MRGWPRAGWTYRETVVDGFEHTVDAFLDLLRGGNTGRCSYGSNRRAPRPPGRPRVARVSTHQSLQHTEAQARFELLDVEQYDVRLDLAASDETFGSVTTIRFTSRGGPTFVDLKPAQVHAIRLNGRTSTRTCWTAAGCRWRRSRAQRAGGRRHHAFRNDGEGLHRSVDPADGRHYVYGMSFMDAAPSIFACFDQPDLKAPYTFHVLAPADWVVIGNAPATNPEPGVWEFEPTQPLSTYFVTLVAGPYHLVRDEHDGIPLGLPPAPASPRTSTRTPTSCSR